MYSGRRVGFCQSERTEKEREDLPALPLLVVIKITPLAALTPNTAAEAGSFNKVTVSISLGSNCEKSPLGIPSITTNGELSPVVLTPLIKRLEPSLPGSPFR